MVYAIVVLVILWTVAGWAHNRTARRLRERMAIIERENVRLAGGVVKAQKDRIEGGRESADAIFRVAKALTEEYKAGDADLIASIEVLNQRLLTLENKQPKIAASPKRANWKDFRSAVERASEPQEADNNG